MPLVAFGTGTTASSGEDSPVDALRAAILGGIRHIDSAVYYGERFLGCQLRRLFGRASAHDTGIISRGKLFITSKIEPSHPTIRKALERYSTAVFSQRTRAVLVRSFSLAGASSPRLRDRVFAEDSFSQRLGRRRESRAARETLSSSPSHLIWPDSSDENEQPLDVSSLTLNAGGVVRIFIASWMGNRVETSTPAMEQAAFAMVEKAVLDLVRLSLKNLGIAKLDLLLAHSAPAKREHLLPFWWALVRMKTRYGLVGSVGVSNFAVADLQVRNLTGRGHLGMMLTGGAGTCFISLVCSSGDQFSCSSD